MRPTLLFICFAVFSTSIFSQTDPTSAPKTGGTLDELIKISSEIYDAGRSGDRTVINKYFADSYLETDVTGALRDKNWNLTNFLPSNIRLTFKIEEPRIREYGQTALLYYKWVVHYERTTPSANPELKSAV